jgi:surface polysaccharide O-acyltransferase-like enzyme
LREDYTVSPASIVSPQKSDQVLTTTQDRAGKVEPSQKKFVPWADLIRVVATILVVTVHVSGQITNLWGQVPESDWFIANIYGGIARICVPLFFMISGYLLLPRRESLGSFYHKRMLKILVPFIAWSLIYLGWFCGNHLGTCSPHVIQDMLFVQGTYYHLWFLYALIGIYLILPLLRLTIGPHTDLKVLWYFIGLWLIFQSGLDLASKFANFTTKLHPPLIAGYVGFFFLGYLLGPWKLSRPTVILTAAAWVLATLVTIFGTYFLTRASGKFDGFFYVFTTPNVIIASGAAFLLLKWFSETKVFASQKSHDFIRWLATGAFGIYLVHILVIEVLQGWIPGIHLDSFIGNPSWSIPLVCLIVFVISFGIVRILQKITVLKRIVPA